MNKTFKTLLAASLIVTTATTPSYAWLDNLNTSEKLAIGTAAVGIIHSAATADERKAEKEQQEAELKQKEAEKKANEAKAVKAAEAKNASKNRVDSLITGNFGYTLGGKMDESKCYSKDRDVGSCYVSNNGNKVFSEALVIYNPINMEITSIAGIKKATIKYKKLSTLKHSQNKEQASIEYANACGKEYNFMVDALMQKGFKESDLIDFPLIGVVQTQGGDFLKGVDRKQSFICLVEETDIGQITFGDYWTTKIAYMLTYSDSKNLTEQEEAVKKVRAAKRNAKAKAVSADF